MENEQKNIEPAAAPVNNPIVATPASGSKTSPWVWILGGCLGIGLISLIIFVALGWWGVNKAKNEMQKHQPEFEQFQKDLEEAGKNAREWEEKAQEIQDAMPSPDDMNYPLPSEGEYQLN